MPRTARASVGNICYHVINRGNGRAEVFRQESDYVRFAEMINEACERLPLRVVSWCLMPNHFHMVLWPYNDGDLSRWMQWLMTCHVRRYHRHYHSDGHVWQGRFKAFPIQEDDHYLTVLRYVERNPVRAKLVKRAEEWRWSSLYTLLHPEKHSFLAEGPLTRPNNWIAIVNQDQSAGELERVRSSVNRGSPFGDEIWKKRMAAKLGLEHSIRLRGRPRKS